VLPKGLNFTFEPFGCFIALAAIVNASFSLDVCAFSSPPVVISYKPHQFFASQ